MRFSLIVATLERAVEMEALLGSLSFQSLRDFELVVVDQNDDDRLVSVVGLFPDLNVKHVRCPTRSLSLARNVGLSHATGEIVAFPDDDCLYQPDTLATVDVGFESDPELALLSGSAVSAEGALSSGRWSRVGGQIDVKTVWTSVIAFNLFLRRDLLLTIGGFDEALGVGTRFGSAEETDLVIRAIRSGAKALYDPALQVIHPDKRLTPVAVKRAFSYGSGMGRVLRKHRIGTSISAQFFIRPVGGILISLLKGRLLHTHYYRRTLQGRLYGYFATMPS